MRAPLSPPELPGHTKLGAPALPESPIWNTVSHFSKSSLHLSWGASIRVDFLLFSWPIMVSGHPVYSEGQLPGRSVSFFPTGSHRNWGFWDRSRECRGQPLVTAVAMAASPAETDGWCAQAGPPGTHAGQCHHSPQHLLGSRHSLGGS